MFNPWMLFLPEIGPGYILYFAHNTYGNIWPNRLLRNALKEIHETIFIPLSNLTNKSFTTGTFPNMCKIAKVTCIWKFVQHQLLHLGFRWQYHILFGYQARIFHFSFSNVSHKSLSFITWNLIEYLHNQDFQRATAHLNVWTNILLFCFMYGCKQHTKI